MNNIAFEKTSKRQFMNGLQRKSLEQIFFDAHTLPRPKIGLPDFDIRQFSYSERTTNKSEKAFKIKFMYRV